MAKLKASQSGFTLIEMLVAIILLSGIVFIASFSFATFSQYWVKQESNFDNQAHQLRNRMAMQNAINGLSNYLLQQDNDTVYFFKGGRQTVQFVTTQPLFSHSQQALVSLEIVPTESNRDELIYREAPIEKRTFLTVSQPPQFRHKVSIMKRERMRFNFYGWASVNTLNAFYERAPVSPEWTASYDAAQTGVMPLALNIIWGDNEPIIFNLPSDKRILQSYTTESRIEGG